MAVTETLTSLMGRYRLVNGTTATGAVSTLNQSLGTLDASAWDVQKAYNIVGALSSVLAKDLYDVQAVKTYTVSDE